MVQGPVPGLSWAQRAAQLGLVASAQEYPPRLHEAAVALARLKVAEALRREDARIAMAVRCLDRVLEAANRTREAFANWRVAARAAGLAGGEADTPLLGRGELEVERLGELRAELEVFIQRAMGSACPNVTAVAGAMLGARLLERAGGLERLGQMPAGTIQVLGADTALFLHVARGRRPPKHGLVFQHPIVKEAPPTQRGRAARVLACHLALAARVDRVSAALSPTLQEKFRRAAQRLRGEWGRG